MTWIKSLLRGTGRLDRPGDSLQQFVQREFDGLSDRGKGVFEFLDFTDCTFRSCALSLSQDWLKNRSMVRHVNLTRCTAAATQVGAAIFEDVVVDGLSTRGLLRCHGSAYRRVVLKGKIGPIMITGEIGAVERQAELDRLNQNYYASSADWALDISAAEFIECDFSRSGIPGELIRRNPETQTIIRRSRVLAADWKHLELSDEGKAALELFLKTPYDDFVFVVRTRGRRLKQDLADLKTLRAAGIASTD